MKKIRVGVIFGGKSAEHEVSLVSAQSVIDALDKNKYEIVPIGISPEGKWLVSGDPMSALKAGMKPLDANVFEQSVPLAVGENGTTSIASTDVVFPVLHGTYGEDGTIQGLLEMLNIPYVGCDVISSALGMDKIMQKTIWSANRLPVVKYVPVRQNEWEQSHERVISAIIEKTGFPCFVKPSNLGSSIGITKVVARDNLLAAIEHAFGYSRSVLVEEGIDAREIECAVLGNDEPQASVPGEVITGGEFYDFKDKYIHNKATTVVPADISAEHMAAIQELAVKAFRTLGCSGLARVDFFLDRITGEIFINEINTIPGFTSISMYPKLWEASGIPYPKLLDRLIELALERYHRKQSLNTSYDSGTTWYQKK